jgi:hypothetical protein
MEIDTDLSIPSLRIRSNSLKDLAIPSHSLSPRSAFAQDKQKKRPKSAGPSRTRRNIIEAQISGNAQKAVSQMRRAETKPKPKSEPPAKW